MKDLKVNAMVTKINAAMKKQKVSVVAGKIRAAIEKNNAVKGDGSRIILNLSEFLQVSGRDWGDKNVSQDAAIGEFLSRLRYFLLSTQVSYESDIKLYILVDGTWYELLRTDWTFNLLPLLREIKFPAQYLNATLIKKLYPKIVEVFKNLDKNYKPISRLLE